MVALGQEPEALSGEQRQAFVQISALALGPWRRWPTLKPANDGLVSNLARLPSRLLPRHLGRVGNRRLGRRLRIGTLRLAVRCQLLAYTMQQ